MTKACPNCNQLNPPDAAFCLNCARPLTAAQRPVGAPPQQEWPQPIGAQMAGRPNTPAPGSSGQKATIALVLSIAGFLCCGPLTGIAGAILGWMELDAIKNGRSPESGRTMATAALWVGIAATVLHAIGYVIFLLASALGASGPAYY